MTCQECSSEISEQDAFCPFCGIALTPVAVPAVEEPAAVEDDDSLESTIMMPREELAAMKELSATPPSGGDNPSSDEEIPDIPLPDILSAPSPEPYAPARQDPDGGSTAARPAMESLESEAVDDAPTESAVEADRHDEVVSFDGAEFGAEVNEIDAAEDSVDDTVEESVHAADEAEVPNGTAEDDEESRLGVGVGKADPEEAIISMIEDSSPESNSGESDGEIERAEADDSREGVNGSEIRIVKPVDELDVHDPFASGAMYDSVRIMENEPSEHGVPDARSTPPEEAVTRIPSQGHSFNSSSERHTTGEEDRSHTSPNMGEGSTDGRRGSKLKPLAEGTILNSRYEIIRKIGGGGMGAVYLASDNNLGGVLRAVKEMVQAHIEEEQQDKAINDFKRESMILSTLDHPAIPTIFDYFFDDAESRFYLVMKYISGGDLSSRLRAAPEGKIDETTVCEWAIQIIDVLDYLHNQPSTIVYRDLKPSNIMVDANTSRVMLIDFGIARSINQKEEKGVTAVGTMGYAPPELFSGNVEPRSDIYSLGSTMFHLLTGADPQSNPLLIFDFQKNPRPRQINPRLSDQMERILMRAVEYNADARFRSAAEMRQVLEDHLAGLRSGNLTFGVSEAPAAVSLANQSVFCGFCGQRIVATDMFCAFCGSKQPLAQQGVQSEIYARSGATAKLFVEGTSELSMPTFSLQKNENLVGRRDPMSNIFPEVDLSKYDPQTKISRRHARIWRDGMNFLVEDLGSSNGTIVTAPARDTIRLTPHTPHALKSGDKLKIGDTTLHFLIG